MRNYCSNTATPHPRRDQGLESPGISRGEDVKEEFAEPNCFTTAAFQQTVRSMTEAG